MLKLKYLSVVILSLKILSLHTEKTEFTSTVILFEKTQIGQK